jgi:ABC-type sulfate/molybdate transport systems ATPase subunit
MADTENPAARLLDELAALDPHRRREVAKELREVAENFAEVPDGKTTSHVLAHSPTYSTQSEPEGVPKSVL